MLPITEPALLGAATFCCKQLLYLPPAAAVTSFSVVLTVAAAPVVAVAAKNFEQIIAIKFAGGLQCQLYSIIAYKKLFC